MDNVGTVDTSEVVFIETPPGTEGWGYIGQVYVVDRGRFEGAMYRLVERMSPRKWRVEPVEDSDL